MEFIQRLLVGDAPCAFLVELAPRAVLVYVLLLIAMRLMGKRVAAQLSITEFAVGPARSGSAVRGCCPATADRKGGFALAPLPGPAVPHTVRSLMSCSLHQCPRHRPLRWRQRPNACLPSLQ